MSTLTLSINTGYLHRSYEIIGPMENYVIVKLNADGRSQEYKTKIVKGNKKSDINWNETININVPRNSWNNAVLEVQIMDEDVTTDDICGAGKINLEHCGFFSQPNVTIPYTIRLYGKGTNEVSGELRFTSTLH